jgi:hypothetical protein
MHVNAIIAPICKALKHFCLLQNQNVMEMAYLSRQNNNCSTASEASASGSGASTSGDEATHPSPSKVNASEAKSWRVMAPNKAAEENYV